METWSAYCQSDSCEITLAHTCCHSDSSEITLAHTFCHSDSSEIILAHTCNGQRPKCKTSSREDNQLARQCYFQSKPSQRRYRKRVIDIWQGCASFQTASQILSDQVRTKINKGWLSDLEILEIYQKTHKRNNDTVPDTWVDHKKRSIIKSTWMTSHYLQKNEKELETLIHAVRIYNQDIGMEFGIEKYAMIVRKSGKRHITDRMELPNQDKIKTLGENET